MNLFVESIEFALEVQCVKAACMDAGVESGKEKVQKQVAASKYDPSEPSFVV